MRQSLCCLALVLAVGAVSQAEEKLVAVVIPGGESDAAGKVGYLSAPKGGVVAVDLAKGEVLWENKDANRPLELLGNQLAVLAPEKGKNNILRVLILDVGNKGKRLVESEPIKLPEWAVVGTGLNHHQAGKFFSAWSHMEKGSLVLNWTAGSRYYGGAAPSPQVLKAATKNASGTASINLESGKVEAKETDKPAPSIGSGLVEIASLPKEVQEVAKKEMWQRGVVVGPRAYGQVVKGTRAVPPMFGLVQVYSIQAVDVKTGQVLWERAFEEQRILPPPP